MNAKRIGVKIGIVRVVSIEDPNILNCHGRVLEEAIPGISTESRCIHDQPKGVYDERSKFEAAVKVVGLIKEFSRYVDVLIVSCTEDPGVKEAREVSRVPVIGAGRAAASLSLSYGDNIGVLGLGEEPSKPIRDVIGDRIKFYRGLNRGTTVDLFTPKGRSKALRAALEVCGNKVDCLLLGCTGFTTVGLYNELKYKVDLPVIDPVVASGLVALYEAKRSMRA
ncbi:MAG: aspartate/glutamate racemase family protein [Candidatus Bathyarchaeia archaeon]|nr:hydantoin racemase [Candidatus Bathyarchaeota archaeon]